MDARNTGRHDPDGDADALGGCPNDRRQATMHTVMHHRQADAPGLRDEIRTTMRLEADEAPPTGGTTARTE